MKIIKKIALLSLFMVSLVLMFYGCAQTDDANGRSKTNKGLLELFITVNEFLFPFLID